MQAIKNKNIYTNIISLFLLHSVVAFSTCKHRPTHQQDTQQIQDQKTTTAAITEEMIAKAESCPFLVGKLRELQNGQQEHINDKNGKYDRTALHYAAGLGERDIVKILLENGADPNKKETKYNTTPLSWAANTGNVDVVAFLLNYPGVNNVNEPASQGQTALYLAACNGYADIVRILLTNKKVDTNRAAEDGRTPLHIAAFKGYLHIVQLLLKQSTTERDLQDNADKTPLDIAQEQKEIYRTDGTKKKAYKAVIKALKKKK